MATLLHTRDAIVAAILAKLRGLRTCRPVHSELDDDELSKAFHLAPAVLVVFLGSPTSHDDGGQTVANTRWGAYVLTESPATEKRNDAAIEIVNTLLVTIPGNRWGIEGAHRPDKVRCENRFSGKLGGKSVALWLVSWYQDLDLDSLVDLTTLDEFKTFQGEMDLAPADGVPEVAGFLQLQGSFMSAYGQIAVTTPVATAIAATDTFQKAAGTTALGPAVDCDMPVNGRLRHTGAVSKPFLVSASLSVVVSADAQVTVALAKNGVVDETTAIEQSVAQAVGAEAFAVIANLAIGPNDYVEVWVEADELVNVTLTKLALSAVAA